MKPSVKAFMNEIIDYAGLFPPADLSLEPAIHNYSDYRKSEDAWMLSRFIIPALRLDELKPYADTLFTEGEAFQFSVLGKGTETVAEYREHLSQLVEAIEQFHAEHGNRVQTDLLEVKLPREAVFANDQEQLVELLNETAEYFGESRQLPGRVFFEVFFEENWQKDIRNVLKALNTHNAQTNHPYYAYSGYKQRCGGVEAHMFPTVEQVAFALTEAKEQNVAVKGTAGLHHPVRHYADEVQTKMHGFFNVFGGAMLSYAHDLSRDQLAEILSEEDADHFTFSDNEFCWKEYAISVDEIRQLRDVALISFGSCSFDEPREDLEQLGLM